MRHTPVLVVGGSIVGLSTAMFLGWHGVPPLVVERHGGSLRHPRARGINPRTVELYRSLGLEEAIFEARSLSADMSEKLMVRARTLAGEEHESVLLADEAAELADGLVTPCEWCPIDQPALEEITAARAAELGAEFRYGTEMVSFEQDPDGVTAVLRDVGTGAQESVRADYLVAADGVGSQIRDRLGIGVQGVGSLMHLVSVVFEADLTGPLRGRDLGLGYFEEPQMGTLLMPLDDSRWVFYTPYAPENGESAESFDDARLVEAVRAAVGVPDLEVGEFEVQMLTTGVRVLGFEMASQVAERLRDGRVFLVGDAAHSMAPTGAFGASTGIQDAHNLAWKLAGVIKGEAGPELLDSYEAERLPVASFTVDQAMAELMSRITGQEEDGLVSYASTILGYRYRSGAVVGATDSGPPALDPRTLGEPGTRAPHVLVDREGERSSTLDLYGRGFVLLAAEHGRAWVQAAQAVAGRLGIDLGTWTVGPSGDLSDVEGRWLQAYGVSATGAVLVRPDGFVAWRAAEAAPEPEAVLLGALARALGRTDVAAEV